MCASLHGEVCAHGARGEEIADRRSAQSHMIDKVGIPDKIVLDRAKEQTGKKSEFMRLVRKNRISHWQMEPYLPWQNRAEDQICEI
jgi:hypothetical protein